MTRFIGDQIQTGFYHESGTYATATGALLWIGLITEHTPDESTNTFELRYVGTGTRNIDMMIQGPKDYDGTLTFHPQDWRFLGFTLGSTTETSGTATGIYQEMSEIDSDASSGFHGEFPSFSIKDIQVASTGSNLGRTFAGGMVDNITIGAAMGELTTCEVSYKAQSVTYSSGAVGNISGTSTVRPYTWDDWKVHLPSGTDISEAKEFSISITNNIETPHYLDGTQACGTPYPLNREYEISLTLDATDTWAKVMYDQYFQGGSEFNLFIFAEGTPGSVYMTFSGCRIIDMEAPSAVEGAIEYSLTIRPKDCFAKSVGSLAYPYNNI
jgi:hypothetical protein